MCCDDRLNPPPYAEETIVAAQTARTLGAKVVAITDSHMSPLAAEAVLCLHVHESTTLGFRALTNSMVMAHGLFVAMVVALEGQKGQRVLGESRESPLR